MFLEKYSQIMRPAVEDELHRVMDRWLPAGNELKTMLEYHLGWAGEGAGKEAQGKRIRPLLVLLSTSAAGGDWQTALPAAAGVELIHNFSLIHDDIEDQSPQRRGRATVWSNWGVPHAINAGDTMFTVAQLAMLELQGKVPADRVVDAMRLLNTTCIELTHGQFLDMSYENRQDLTLDAYWPMVGGKTAALLGCCTELGAIVASAEDHRRSAFRHFGISLGMAFQILDDLLGIWGDSAITGKSTESDLVSGKKTLPVLYALGRNGRFAQRWANGPVLVEEVPVLSDWLAEEGAQVFTQETADRLTVQAQEALNLAVNDHNEAAIALRELADVLLKRKN